MRESLNRTSNRIQRFAVVIFIVVATGALAYWAGGLAASGIRNNSDEELIATRNVLTQQLLSEMSSIRLGGTLFNQFLKDSTGNVVTFSGAGCKSSLVSFLDLSCTPCIKQLDNVGRVSADMGKPACFTVISATDPVALRVIADSLGASCAIFFDSTAAYQSSLGIHSTPFNIQLDNSGVIVAVYAGMLTEREIKSILSSD